MTYRERREAKAEKLREWSDKRVVDASAVFERNRVYTEDHAFNTQPGHIPLRARVIRQEDRAHESLRKARDMASRADGIESQLDRSIYDDDPDAIERLTERIEALEAERERIKAYNASCRKGTPNLGLLDDRQRDDILTLARIGHGGKGGAFPSYHLSNLSGNIKRNRDRLASVTERQARERETVSAGGVLVENLAGGYVRVTFAEKPERTTLDALKAAGFRWGRGSWTGKADQLPAEVTD